MSSVGDVNDGGVPVTGDGARPVGGHDVAMVRAVTHMHTNRSWDGNIRPSRLVDGLVALGVGIAMVTDHDTFDGSLECRRLAGQRAADLRVPVAAEIRTDRGDVIVAFEDESAGVPPVAELKQWRRLEPLVRDLGGLIWLPHPYQSHEFVEELAAASDVVEVFNARCSDEQNRNGDLLCGRHGSIRGYGADVHRIGELGGCVVAYEDRGGVLATLRQTPQPIRAERSLKSGIMAAEITNGRKRRRPALVAYFAVRWMQHRKREIAAQWSR